MATVHRFQLDMTKQELESVERLGQLAGLRTKREVMASALALFKWAAKEILYGQTVCSIDEATGKVKQYDNPALSAIAEAAARNPLLTPEQYAERLKEPARTSAELSARAQGALHVDSGMVSDGGPSVVGPMEQSAR